MGLITVFVLCILCIMLVVCNVIASRKKADYWAPHESEKKLSFTKFDWIAIVAITVIYGGIALLCAWRRTSLMDESS